ncbi:MAG: fertility inhibition FinO-like protein [Blastocatellia bacterium]|nr:fertility inhibition FinO-like protein [Blastocatellia bacterium]
MPVLGKMEVVIKISEFPEDVKTVTNNWKEFVVEADNKQITVTARPKMFNKIEQAKQQFPQWVAAISGKIGDMNEKGFNLVDASIQVFERKPKPEAQSQPAS